MALVEGVTPRLIQILRYHGASPEDAEEAAQEALINCHLRLESLDLEGGPGKDPFFNYLITAARNAEKYRHRRDVKRGRGTGQIESLDERRSIKVGDHAREADPEDEAADDSWDSAHQGNASSEDPRLAKLREFLDTLSPEDMLMLQWDAEDALTSKEIGLEVGLKAANVRQRVRRLHRRFEDYLKGQR